MTDGYEVARMVKLGDLRSDLRWALKMTDESRWLVEISGDLTVRDEAGARVVDRQRGLVRKAYQAEVNRRARAAELVEEAVIANEIKRALDGPS